MKMTFLKKYLFNYMKESLIEQKVVEFAKELNYLPVKNLGIKGMPDRRFYLLPKTLFGCNAFSFYMEFKTLEGKMKPMQEYQKSTLEKYGKYVYIVRSIEQGKSILEHHLSSSEEFINYD